MMRKILLLLFLGSGCAFFHSCAPKEPVALKEIHLKDAKPSSNGDVMLTAEASFFNPNKNQMKLKRIVLDITVDGKPAAHINQDMDVQIKAQSTFSVPFEARLKMKELGLLDTIFGLLGGKKYDVQFTGSMKLSKGGFPITIPIDRKESLSW